MSPKGQRVGSPLGARLTPSSMSAHKITFTELDKIGNRLPRPSAPYQESLLLFILPTHSNLVVGPLKEQPGDSHTCLAMHLWNGFTRSVLDEVRGTIQCGNECFQDMAFPVPMFGPEPTAPGLPRELSPSLADLLSRASRPRTPLPDSPSFSPLIASSQLPSQRSHPSPPEIMVRRAEPELRAMSVAAALHEWCQQIDHSITMATAPFSPEDTLVRIITVTPGDAAQGFFDSCMSWCASALGFGVPDDMHSLPLASRLGTILQNCNPTTIIFNNVRVSIGDGVGDGPQWSFWAALMDLIMKQSNHWQQVGEDGYYVPVITTLPPSDEDLQAFRAYGLVLCTGLIWGMDLLPVSPALICYLISNYAMATSPAFLKAILSQTFARLSTWPPPLVHVNSGEAAGSMHLQILPAADPYTMILEFNGNISINQLRTLSPSQQIVLYDQLVAFMVFKNQAIKNEQDSHPIYSSLSLAFNERVFGAARFHTCFTSNNHDISPMNVIAGLFANRSVSSVDQILGLLDATPPTAFSLNNPGSNARLDYLALAIKWNDHLK
ncbi:hypothetical protein JVT61DRAFT_14696 [Boletus reticuloceps]|uniref:Uncharacterized protein n=1 Tax=Boletus reticuloceps TaxID=495285 RepID=A0A8I2YUH2_9AGAM|nr:hypothetical protein JVT61DRAFT_14696 [Boletus reticuloceps]